MRLSALKEGPCIDFVTTNYGAAYSQAHPRQTKYIKQVRERIRI